MSYLESKKFEIVPMETYKIIKGCSGCGNKSVFHNTNKVRVNANGKEVDVWLVYKCLKCKHTYNISIYSRVRIDVISKLEYCNLQINDLELINRYWLDKTLFKRNNATIYGEPTYILKYTGTIDQENTLHFTIPTIYQLE